MAAKPLNVTVGQPATEIMNKMVKQIAQMVAPVKTTMWGGHHDLLALVLNNTDYSSITKAAITSTMSVLPPNAINKGITDNSTPLKFSPFRKKPRGKKGI